MVCATAFFILVALCKTVLLSHVNTTLENGEVLVINNNNQVVLATDKETKTVLAGIQEKLDSINKTNAELNQKVQALDQKIFKMQHADYGLLFSKIGTSDYVIIRGMRSLNAMTLCFWMKTADQRSEAAPISYAASNVANEILFINHKNFRLAIANEERTTSVSANDRKWHHICATWENTAGSWTFYKDGVMKASGSGFKKGHVIRAGGTLVLGQEQDTVGGHFDANQCFIGQLTGVNIWNRVVPRTEIFLMSKSCLSGEGNVFRWSEFKAHIQGGVEAIAPSSCSP